MSWDFREENHIRPPQKQVLLRRYPYPYRAALTISNDIDRTTPASFDDVYDYVCGTGVTPYGEGLGLELSNSYWLWASDGVYSLYHHSPFDADPELSPESERLIALAQAGVFDTLHGFGQWPLAEGGLNRNAMQRGLDLLDRHGLKPTIWVNHGGGAHMHHQIEGRWAYEWFGDQIGHPGYCYDLLKAFGFTFFTNGIFTELKRFGEHCHYNNQASFDADLNAYEFRNLFRRFNPNAKTMFEPYGALSDDNVLEIKKKYFNKILFEDVAEDGNPILYFKRYRGLDTPNAGSFMCQVNHFTLHELRRSQGAAIIYQHFGAWRAAMTPRSHPSHSASTPPVFDVHNQASMESLADYNRNGEVWVPALRRFLDYTWLQKYLDYNVKIEDGVTIIQIHAVDCPVHGRRDVSMKDINGLAFTFPKEHEKVVVSLGGKDVTEYFRRDDEPNFSARDVLYSPYERQFSYIPSTDF